MLFYLINFAIISIILELLDILFLLILQLKNTKNDNKNNNINNSKIIANKKKLKKLLAIISNKYHLKLRIIFINNWENALSYNNGDIEVGDYFLDKLTCSSYIIGHEIGHIILKRKFNISSSNIKMVCKLIEYMADFIGVYLTIKNKNKYVPMSITIQVFPKLFMGRLGKGIFGIFLSDHPEDCCRLMYIFILEIIINIYIKFTSIIKWMMN